MDVATRLIDSITGASLFWPAFPSSDARATRISASARAALPWGLTSLSIASKARTFSSSGWYTADATLKRCSIGDHEARNS